MIRPIRARFPPVTFRRRNNSYIVWDQRGLSAAISRRLSPRATTPALIRSQSTRHLVAKSSCSGKIDSVTKQTENRCRCRRISRSTMGGRDGLFSLTFTYFIVLPSAAGGVTVLQCLSFAPTVPPAGFLPIRGCPSCVPGFGSEHYCSNISSSLKLVL